jgi:hypothetical protein
VRRRPHEVFLAWVFGAMLLLMLALLTRGPSVRVHLDYGGGAYLEESSWWGLSTRTIPLQRVGDEWHFKARNGEWVPYTIESHIPEVDGTGTIR